MEKKILARVASISAESRSWRTNFTSYGKVSKDGVITIEESKLLKQN